jgi:3-oxoacyl-[acyl-carrier protein] reductase
MEVIMIDPGLKGKNVLITGANNPRGIGAAIAKGFARLGCRVFLHFFRGCPAAENFPELPGEELYRALQSLSAAEIVGQIRNLGGTAYCWEADLEFPGGVPELLNRAEGAMGPVEVLVNNAARGIYDTFLPEGGAVYGESSPAQALLLTAESHDANFCVNVRAPALLMADFARRHAARGANWGRIINISTDASAAHAGAISYGASKHALESYARAAAWELARFGITVNVIAPGPIQTGWMTPALEAESVSRIPLGRIGLPEDVADVVIFLASEQARWVTGQTLYVGGGNVMPL